MLMGLIPFHHKLSYLLSRLLLLGWLLYQLIIKQCCKCECPIFKLLFFSLLKKDWYWIYFGYKSLLEEIGELFNMREHLVLLVFLHLLKRLFYLCRLSSGWILQINHRLFNMCSLSSSSLKPRSFFLGLLCQ
jgi:hypothetical protein